MKIYLHQTKQDYSKQIVNILEKYYTSSWQHIRIGFTLCGELDYGFDCYPNNIELCVVNTCQGVDQFGDWSMSETTDDFTDPEFWTEDNKKAMQELMIDYQKNEYIKLVWGC